MGGSQPEGVEEVGLHFVLGGRSEHLEVGEVRDIFYYRIVKTEPEKNLGQCIYTTERNILGTELLNASRYIVCVPEG